MDIVRIKASKDYNVYIGAGLIDEAGKIIRDTAGGSKACIITDSNVDKFYSEKVTKQLEDNGYEVLKFVFPAGEESKHLGTLAEILSFMAQNHLSRKDIAVALGGGVVGDITGFSAACYMRGIKFVQIPTTVLAAVDSSVGGKTAVDLPEGKNLAGAFYQPETVICDTDTFGSLPERDYNNGFAEIIKYGMIRDEKIFDMLDGHVSDIVKRCVEIKADVVEEDEFEGGVRQILNFGHSIGHAVEKASDFSLLHGEAVAIGMVRICDIAIAEGKCDKATRDILVDALKKYKLPTCGDYAPDTILEIMRSDKKADGATINLIMPVKPGTVNIEKTGIEEVGRLLKLGE